MKKPSLLLLCLLVAAQLHSQTAIDLSGRWQLGFGQEEHYDDSIELPGSNVTRGKGPDVTLHTPWTGSLYDSSFYFNPAMQRYRVESQLKFPFFLTPRKHYVGTAWYRRTVTVPETWKNRRVILFLERPHIETTVSVNGHEVGHRMSLSVPHEYDLTAYVRPGEENEIAIKIYNGIENVCVGQDSHSVTDQTQGNWNGIAGRIALLSRPKCYVERMTVVPDVDKHLAHVFLYMNDYTPPPGGRKLKGRRHARTRLRAELANSPRRHVVTADGAMLFAKNSDGYIHLTLDMTDSCALWDEFHPAFYRLTATYGDDTVRTVFGMRRMTASGRQLLMNGKPIFLRGTVENCCFPETGYPPTDEASWLRVFSKCKDYGLNHIRFHSYCPPEAAFAAADQLGLYLQPEGPSWPNHGVRLRRGQPIDQYLLEECKRIVDAYGHHPSFTMMAAGNEPAGDWVSWCNDFVEEMRRYDPTKLWCGASVGGGWAWDDGSQYHVKGGARGLDWDRRPPQSADDFFNQLLFPRNYKDIVANTSPIIAHEQGQWCAFPDFSETADYTGAYQPRNFEIFRDLLADNGMSGQARRFLDASGRLQVLAYKYEIERNLRTRDYAGFQLLGLNDYSGQGTALVGPLNVHWREKGYCDAGQWREFCSPVVPLARFPRFVFENTDTLRVPVEVYNATDHTLSGVECAATISDGVGQERVLLSDKDIPVGKNTEAGVLVCALDRYAVPTRLTITIDLSSSGGVSATPLARNHYEAWVYPAAADEPRAAQPLITDTLDARALRELEKGGTVLLAAAGKIRYGSDVSHHFLPVFWNTSWFKMRPPHTTGAYIQSEHPVFGLFPTDHWQNLNWWELVNRAQAMNLSEFPADYQPIVQPIDTWHVSRKLGMMVEANVLGGRLLLTTLDISTDLDRRIAARQLRRSILAYMRSDRFRPALTLSPEVVAHLFTREAPPVDMFTRDSPDELKPKLKP